MMFSAIGLYLFSATTQRTGPYLSDIKHPSHFALWIYGPLALKVSLERSFWTKHLTLGRLYGVFGTQVVI